MYVDGSQVTKGDVVDFKGAWYIVVGASGLRALKLWRLRQPLPLLRPDFELITQASNVQLLHRYGPASAVSWSLFQLWLAGLLIPVNEWGVAQDDVDEEVAGVDDDPSVVLVIRFLEQLSLSAAQKAKVAEYLH